MNLRAMWMAAALAAGLVVTVSASSCKSSTPAPVAVGGGCTLNSDCDNPLVCLFQICHQECQTDRDCTDPVGSICVNVTGGSVCETPSEQSCADGGACTIAGTTCNTADHVCRQQCTASSQCAGNDTCYQGECYCQENCDSTNTLPDGAVVTEAGPEASGSSSGGNDGAPEASSSGGGPLGYTPSNLGNVTIADGGIPDAGDAAPLVGGDGGIAWSNAVDVTISLTNCTAATCLPAPILITQSDMSTAALYVVKSFTIDSSAILTLQGTPYPVIIASLGPVDIGGTIAINGLGNEYAGAGGWDQSGQVNQGLGGGANGLSGAYPNSGAGGGSYCGMGGKGSAPPGDPVSPAGSLYGTATLTPLVAGSAGGYFAGTSYASYSGGALQISSGVSIIVRGSGVINAGGSGSAGGGASGGAILLEAPTITMQGILAANGGAGGLRGGYGNDSTPSSTPATGGTNGGAPGSGGGNGSAGTTINGSPGMVGDGGSAGYPGAGGGGAGFIRLNSTDAGAGITGTISPALTTSCASQGTIH